MARDLVLTPYPRRIRRSGKPFTLRPVGVIRLVGPVNRLLSAGEWLQEMALVEANCRWNICAGEHGPDKDAVATIRLDRKVRHDQGYELVVSSDGIDIRARTPQGAFHAVAAVGQLLMQSRRCLPAVHIEDEPDLPARGVMLDISRDKVPTMATLYELVDLLALLKYNQLQLYTEHTFQYRQHPIVWKTASPMSGEDILRLQEYCRERFIEMVPNQNSFGHMERWLKHSPYRPLAECPDGFRHTPNGPKRAPTSLCPTDPGSMGLVRSMFNELLPHFTSDLFNVGCDETWEIGVGRSKALCERKGVGRVYLDFLMKIYKSVTRHNRTMMFWGDIVLKHPELIAELPRDLIALEWGYEVNHAFDERAGKFAEAGVPFYICPGTGTWNSIGGRTANMMGNLSNAGKQAMRHGAIGFLNTDWGDSGHWQYLPVSYGPIAYGAAACWCSRKLHVVDLAEALNLFVFRDAAGVMGDAALDLGRVTDPMPARSNCNILFRILQSPLVNTEVVRDCSREVLKAGRYMIDDVVARLSKAQMDRPDADLVEDEFRNAARLLRHACRLGSAKLATRKSGGAVKVGTLAKDLQEIIPEHRRLWLARNRPGGLRESAGRMEKLLAQYEG